MTPRISVLIIIFISSLSSYAQTFKGKVMEVIDGNTFMIVDEYEEVSLFKLREADSPEIGQPLGDEAKAFVEDMMLKKKVTVERAGKDWLGNKLAIITKNGKVVHEELINAGLAWADRKASDASTNLMDVAKNKRIGLWAFNEPTPPWIYRRQQTMMQAKSR